MLSNGNNQHRENLYSSCPDQGVLSKGSGNVACSPLALHCGGKSYLGAQLDKEGGHLA